MPYKIVHCKRGSYDVYCGRPSKWGNPFVIGKDGSRAEVIEKYRVWIQTNPSLMTKLLGGELKNKILGCWCNFPKEDCHCRILHELSGSDT